MQIIQSHDIIPQNYAYKEHARKLFTVKLFNTISVLSNTCNLYNNPKTINSKTFLKG